MRKLIIQAGILFLFLICLNVQSFAESAVKHNFINLGLINNALGIQYEYQFDYKSIIHGPSIGFGPAFGPVIVKENYYYRVPILYKFGIGGWYHKCTMWKSYSRECVSSKLEYLVGYIHGGVNYSTKSGKFEPLIGAGLSANVVGRLIFGCGVDLHLEDSSKGFSFNFGYSF